MGSSGSWGGGRSIDDGSGAWDWMRLHRLYSAAVVAIVLVTLISAQWAGQPSTEVGTTSSSPSVMVEVPLPSVR